MTLLDIIIIVLYSYIMVLSASALLVILSADKKYSQECYCVKFRHRHIAICIMIILSSAFVIFSQWVNPISSAYPWALAMLANSVGLVFGTWNMEEKERDRLIHHKCLIDEK
jgi:uncharacterized membrane protein YbjE (DUF340 family)